MPRELDMSRLQRFRPRQRRESGAGPGDRGVSGPDPDHWPSRETPKEGQFTIRAPLATTARFRKRAGMAAAPAPACLGSRWTGPGGMTPVPGGEAGDRAPARPAAARGKGGP